MSRYSTEVQNLHYNAATGAFEALVVLHEGSDKLKFPCSVKRPIDTDFHEIARLLTTQAKTARKRGALALVSRSRISARPDAAALATLTSRLLTKFIQPGPAHAA